MTMRLIRPILLFLSILLLLPFGADHALAGNNWNPAKILQALKYPYQNGVTTVVLISHRGVVGHRCPENSACSILEAYRTNVEAVELDVKQSADGTPWLFHDQNAGRMIVHSPPFVIFQNKAPPIGWNPDISAVHDREIRGWFLQDKAFVPTNYRPLSLADALTLVKHSAPHMVVVLDIKTVDAVRRSVAVVKQLGMQGAVVLKFSASLFAGNPFGMSSLAGGIAFVPTIYAGNLDDIALNYTRDYCSGLIDVHQCRVENWVNAILAQGAAWVEIGNKAPVWNDPTNHLVAMFKRYARTPGRHYVMGAFVPVPEYPALSPKEPDRHYVRSNATCCASLGEYLTTTRFFGRETVDRRESVDLQLDSGFTSIITDNADAARHVIERRGFRHTWLYQ